MKRLWGLFFYHLNVITPRPQLTRMLGKLANSTKPWLKDLLIKSFVKSYDLGADYLLPQSLKNYPSFNDFFSRKTDQYIDLNPLSITSPCEGKIAGVYPLDTTLSIYQKSFEFHALLTIPALYAPKPSDQVIPIYLAPENYHRVHSPLNGVIHAITLHKGDLFSVNPSILPLFPTLLEQNERVCITLSTQIGFMHIIMIGALIVGSIQLSIQEGQHVQKGDELGWFELGSSVILVLPCEITLHKLDGMVRVGSQLGRIHP